jgi:UDP-glucose 4-epimerase
VDNLSTGRLQNLNPRADLLEADICELDSIRPAVAGVDTVFHGAALARVPLAIDKPVETHRVNAVGTLNVLIAARDSNAA